MFVSIKTAGLAGIGRLAVVLAISCFQAVNGLGQTVPFLGGLTEAEVREGWLSLFDGQSTFGWHAMNEANWQIEAESITVDQGTVGLIRTSTQFDDFDLQLEIKADPRTNSGIFFRTSPRPIDPTGDCFEFNIASPLDSPFPTGSLVGRVACKHNFDLSDWTKVRIVADGDRILGWINGIQTCDYRAAPDKELGRGYLGLQYNSGKVAFRNIRILPLSVPPLTLDPALSQFQTAETRLSKFSVDTKTEPVELHIFGGPGQLETRRQFADFIYQLQCRTGKPGMNSGIFFRCVPGAFMNGYESQIQNQIQGQDRSKPVDCGTGGVFRRSAARFVNADDEQWFAMTIVACGPNISTWVNGVQVADWTDRRSLDPNPRKGRRLEAGTIILQGHDPGTDMRLREIKVRELKTRIRRP
jgi:hypothetical protein